MFTSLKPFKCEIKSNSLLVCLVTITEGMVAADAAVVEEEVVGTETEATTAGDPPPPTTVAGEGVATTGPGLALTLLVSIVATSFAICKSVIQQVAFPKCCMEMFYNIVKSF